MEWYFTNLDVPEIMGPISLSQLHFGVKNACEVAIIWPEIVFQWNIHTVDGQNPTNQLRLVVYTIIYRVYACQVVSRMSSINRSTLKIPKTNSSPLKLGKLPKGNDRIPTIHGFRCEKTLASWRVYFNEMWVFPKIMVPPNHPFVHRVFHEIFTIHFGG